MANARRPDNITDTGHIHVGKGLNTGALGSVLIGLWALNPASRPFFRGESLNRETPVLVPEE